MNKQILHLASIADLSTSKPYRFSWNLRSPSPLPSPPGRGRRFSSAGECSPFSDFPGTAIAASPLLGKRARVRASCAHVNCFFNVTNSGNEFSFYHENFSLLSFVDLLGR